MNDAELLRAALPYLWDGRSSLAETVFYVCVAISIAGRDCTKDVQRIRSTIWNRLGGATFLEQWLRCRGIDTSKCPPHVIQDYRRRWMVSMIAEAEANGGYLK